MQEMTNKEMQEVELEILKVLSKICEEQEGFLISKAE